MCYFKFLLVRKGLLYFKVLLSVCLCFEVFLIFVSFLFSLYNQNAALFLSFCGIKAFSLYIQIEENDWFTDDQINRLVT